MDAKKGVWSGLPFELIERVLCFLPVTDLCRFRSVCKRWNELLCKPSFHHLAGQSRERDAYLFITRHLDYGDWSMVDPTFRRTTCFLDLDVRRWYLIKPDESPLNGLGMTQLLAMDDGLVCELTALPGADEDYALAISDPIAKTRMELPSPPIYCFPDDVLPTIVTDVDTEACSFRVFVVINSKTADTRLYLYESSTDEWRGMKNPQVGVRDTVSAVMHRGILYAVFRRVSSRGRFVLLSYNLQEDVWREVSMSNLRKKQQRWIVPQQIPQLVVSRNRLFMMMWLHEPCSLNPVPGSRRKFQLFFELREIFVAGNASRTVAKIKGEHLQEIFGERNVDFDIAYAVPRINSHGFCHSLVLMSTLTGKLVSYDLVSGLGVVLPAPPLPQASLEEIDTENSDPFIYYHGKHMNLSLRNLPPRVLG